MNTLQAHSFPRLATATALMSAVFLAACTTTPPSPPPQIALATAAIESAHVAGADEAARADMLNARTKLEGAQLAALSGDERRAWQLATEAEVDAQAARARAAYFRAAQILGGVEADVQELRMPLAPPVGAPR